MNTRLFRISALVIGAFVHTQSAAAPDAAGSFGPPILDTQTGPDCSEMGYKRDQYHMQLNPSAGTNGKYHAGEDLNGWCGGDKDLGYPLYVVSDGEVVFRDDEGAVSGQGKRLYIRHSIPYALAPNGVFSFDVAMLHLNDISPGMTVGTKVKRSDGAVAELGDTGTTDAHLHWEMRTDLSMPDWENPYQEDLSIDHALRYLPPSLVIDDRRYQRNYTVNTAGQWSSFTAQETAPSSTMYLEYYGERKSIKNAIAAGWTDEKGVLFEDGGTWYYYGDVDNVFFEAGKQYAIMKNFEGVTHHILVPQHNFQGDRARLDMLHAVEGDSRFDFVKTETYEYNPDWMTTFELHKMEFETSGGTTWVFQATQKENPLIRYTSYIDPNTGVQTGWQGVDWNELY